MSNIIGRVGCRNLVTSKKVLEPVSRRIEASYQSNLWVASLPLTVEEESSLKIVKENRVLMISGDLMEHTWTQEILLPYDARPESVNARAGSGWLYITAQLEEQSISGKEIPILQAEST